MESQFEVRDLFAAHVMAALVANHYYEQHAGNIHRLELSPKFEAKSVSKYARMSFYMADAMMDARQLEGDELASLLNPPEPDHGDV